MPIHDWSRVNAGIFHAFHHGWIGDISRALNRGLLPSDYYALPEQIAGWLASEPDAYAAKAKSVVIRHTSNHRVIAIVEIVSPGNKNSRHGLRAFVDKAVEMLRGGVHLLVVDLFPPGPHDPQGIHKAVWDEFIDNEFVLPADRPLTLAAYIGGACPEAFVEPTAVRAVLVEMPLFLTEEVYVPVPLEVSYQSAFEGLPSFWRDVLNGGRAS